MTYLDNALSRQQIHIVKLKQNAGERDFEIVERKGSGHPDTLCDNIAETASRLYSRYCLTHFGRVPHHWFDKVMLIGGDADINFGQASLLEPYRVIFAGKAARAIGETEIPVSDILHDAAKLVLTTQLTGFDPAKDLLVEDRVRKSRGPGQGRSRYSPASVSELDVFGDDSLVSNDCNLCIGYAPLSKIEHLVLSTEAYLQAPETRKDLPFIGHDIKLVGTRHLQRLSLLINVPMLASQVSSFDDYLEKVDRVTKSVKRHIRQTTPDDLELTINPERKWGRAYLTVTGTVADTGDVGVTGRGNRQNGLITPTRPMSMEATAGKNPLDHTGKLYGVLARDLASEIASYLKTDAIVSINTSKGAKLSKPDSFVIELGEVPTEDAKVAHIRDLAEQAIQNLGVLSKRLATGSEVLW